MYTISSNTFKTWERFYRANFINSLTGFKSVSLIGTVNKKGQCNLGVFSSVVHIGSDPALVGYINRPRKAAPHTLANIEATGSYTINHIHADFLPRAHQTSAKYSEGINEFEAVGLTPEFDENNIAPYVKESKVKYALNLKEIIPIPFNNTFLVIGEIQHIKIDSEIMMTDGFLALEKIGTLCSNGIDSYYTTQLVDRYRYAKPDLKPETF
ncbi:MAG: flavin reductase [Cyclobacteriaceae bacterium]|nr:flavin reductase [Cyclobacteriaceae bacterium]